jgi:hypothetical protein
MKKLLTISLLLTSFFLHSSTIESKQAYLIAERFNKINQIRKSKLLDSPILVEHSGKILAYAFIFEDKGYIVVSADDQIIPVISYNKESIYFTNSPLDNLIRADLLTRLNNIDYQSNTVKDRIRNEWIDLNSNSKSGVKVQQWPEEGSTSTGGWTETMWHQNSPYNQFCPIKLSNGQRSVVGCPATAMAQILHFHRQINGTQFVNSDRYYHNYTQNFWIDDAWETYDFLSFDSLNVYLDSIEFKYVSKSELNNEEKAALSLASAFACKSVFDPDGSGTFSVSQAYQAYLKFGFDNAVLLDSDFTDEQIRQKMIINIKNALPVHLATVDQNWYYGHNVVCDGYRDNGYFRINFGWGGTYDNWYSLPEGFPLSLTVFEGIVADINGVTYSEYPLTLLCNPDNIEVELEGSGDYIEGAEVEISVGEVDGYIFTHWSSENDDIELLVDANSSTTSFIMPDRSVEFTANFQPTFTVSFLVKDNNQNLIEGATISLNNIDVSITTNEEGIAEISLTNDDYEYTVTAENYYNFSDSFVVDGSNQTITINLIALGIEISNLPFINIYPNPFRDKLSFNNSYGNLEIKISSTLGTVIKEIKLTQKGIIGIPMADVKPGYYIIKIITEEGVNYSMKILKL